MSKVISSRMKRGWVRGGHSSEALDLLGSEAESPCADNVVARLNGMHLATSSAAGSLSRGGMTPSPRSDPPRLGSGYAAIFSGNPRVRISGSHSIYDVGHLLAEMDRRILNSIIWYKPNAQPNITCRTLTESTEQIVWACNGSKQRATGWVFDYQTAKRLNGGRQLRNVWSIPTTRRSERAFGRHPTQKPLMLLSRLISITTQRGDLVLDCFAGSGTTAVAAQKLGRRWVLIEENSGYVQVARNRLSESTLRSRPGSEA